MPLAPAREPASHWLKKAAKQRLAQLRAKAPDARLHQAQLAVSKDYGFKSWRALKGRVETLNPPARDSRAHYASLHVI